MEDVSLPTPELSVSLASLEFPGAARERLTAAVAWVRSLGGRGVRAVQLDVSGRGIRPRELDRSSRREVASIARREGVTISGVDLWIPPEHFVEDGTSDRAMASSMEAMGFLAEVAPLSGTTGDMVLSMRLPGGEGRAMDARWELAESAARFGVRVADHAWPPVVAEDFAHDSLGIGIDPSSVQLSGETLSAGRALARHAERVVSARLSDTDGASRVPAGEGRLNVFEYVATYVTCGVGTPLVVDLREVASPRVAAGRIIEAVEGGSTV